MPLEQTPNGAAPPSLPLPPQIMQRINPSPELQQQVAAAIQACTTWQPVVVETVKGSPLPPQASTEAQVCDVLNRWPVMHEGRLLLALSMGVGLAIAAVGGWMAARAVLRRAFAMIPSPPVAKFLIARAIEGALCGAGVVTFWILLTLPWFVAATIEQRIEKALVSWSSTTPWAAGVFAMLFALSAVPGGWWRQALLAARPKVALRWRHRED